MEDIKITIRNYRSIPYDNPISMEVGPGITFILGVNNIGKSNLLRLFYEFRNSIHHSAFYRGGNLNFNPSNLLYSSVKNQNSDSDQILLALEYASKSIEIKIGPLNPANLDTNQYRQDVGETEHSTFATEEG